MKYYRQVVIFGLIFLTCLSLILWPRHRAVSAEIQSQSINYLNAAEVQQVAESTSCMPEGQKIDLNNANALVFMDCPGYYPTLAKEIITHSPYDSVEGVLDIPDLNPQQQQLLQGKLDIFTVTEPKTAVSTRMPPRPMMR